MAIRQERLSFVIGFEKDAISYIKKKKVMGTRTY